MATSYREADEETYEILSDVMREYFPNLSILDPKPRITILMAHSEKVPALKLHGWPCAAVIKIVKGEERANGGPDVRILVDAFLWAGMKDRRRRALLAHELHHLSIKTHIHEDAARLGCPLDDYGRPDFKTRPADWQAEGFRQLVEWFGDDALEKIELGKIIQDVGQDVFGFAKEDPDPGAAVNSHLAAVEREADGETDDDTTVTLTAGGRSVTVTGEQFERAARDAGGPRKGWDAVTSRPLTPDQAARADEQAAEEAAERDGKRGRKRKAQATA